MTESFPSKDGDSAALGVALENMRFLMFEKMEDRWFRPLSPVPKWFLSIYPESCRGDFVDLENLSYVLDLFLEELEDHWARRRSHLLRSLQWQDYDSESKDRHLGAGGFFYNEGRFILIHLLGAAQDHQTHLLQSAREAPALKNSLNREQQKGDLLLKFLADHSTTFLHESVARIDTLQRIAEDSSMNQLLTDYADFLNSEKRSIFKLLYLLRYDVDSLRNGKLGASPAKCIRAAFDDVFETARLREISMSFRSSLSSNTSVYGDDARLENVVANLLGYSVEHMSLEGSMMVALESDPTDVEKVSIEIFESLASIPFGVEAFSHPKRTYRWAMALHFVKTTIEHWGGKVEYLHEGRSGKWRLSLKRAER